MHRVFDLARGDLDCEHAHLLPVVVQDHAGEKARYGLTRGRVGFEIGERWSPAVPCAAHRFREPGVGERAVEQIRAQVARRAGRVQNVPIEVDQEHFEVLIELAERA